MKNLRIAIIGYGYWGPNLVRNFLDKKNCVVTHVVDKIPERLEEISFIPIKFSVYKIIKFFIIRFEIVNKKTSRIFIHWFII